MSAPQPRPLRTFALALATVLLAFVAISHGSITSGPVFVDAETPAGLVDGSNVVFTLLHAPAAAGGSLHLFRNGLRQNAVLDYTLSGNTITFLGGDAVPQPGDILLADYRL